MIIQDYCNLTDSKVAYSFSKSNNKARAKTKKNGSGTGSVTLTCDPKISFQHWPF